MSMSFMKVAAEHSGLPDGCHVIAEKSVCEGCPSCKFRWYRGLFALKQWGKGLYFFKENIV